MRYTFFLPHGVLLSELACDALPSRVALLSELRATAIDGRSEIRFYQSFNIPRETS